MHLKNPSACSSLISAVLLPPSDRPRLRFKPCAWLLCALSRVCMYVCMHACTCVTKSVRGACIPVCRCRRWAAVWTTWWTPSPSASSWRAARAGPRRLLHGASSTARSCSRPGTTPASTRPPPSSSTDRSSTVYTPTSIRSTTYVTICFLLVPRTWAAHTQLLSVSRRPSLGLRLSGHVRTRRHSNHSGDDFKVYRPAGATRCIVDGGVKFGVWRIPQSPTKPSSPTISSAGWIMIPAKGRWSFAAGKLRQVCFIPLVDKRKTVWSLVNMCHTSGFGDE